jgi:hypothetical protein
MGDNPPLALFYLESVALDPTESSRASSLALQGPAAATGLRFSWDRRPIPVSTSRTGAKLNSRITRDKRDAVWSKFQ